MFGVVSVVCLAVFLAAWCGTAASGHRKRVHGSECIGDPT